QDLHQPDLNELRRKLGLPTRDKLDPAQVDVAHLPIVRFSQLVVDQLPDEALVQAYRRAARMGAPRTVLPFVREVIRRPSLSDKVDLAEAHAILARLTEDTAQAIAHSVKALELATARG